MKTAKTSLDNVREYLCSCVRTDWGASSLTKNWKRDTRKGLKDYS